MPPTHPPRAEATPSIAAAGSEWKSPRMPHAIHVARVVGDLVLVDLQPKQSAAHGGGFDVDFQAPDCVSVSLTEYDHLLDGIASPVLSARCSRMSPRVSEPARLSLKVNCIDRLRASIVTWTPVIAGGVWSVSQLKILVVSRWLSACVMSVPRPLALKKLLRSPKATTRPEPEVMATRSASAIGGGAQ